MKLNKEFFPKGWHVFYFVITPDQFGQIFSEMPAVFVADKKVDEPLQTVPKEEVVEKYKVLFYNILHKRCETNLIEGWFQEQIIDDLGKIQAEPIAEADKKRFVFQSLLPAEPTINLSPFDLIYLPEKHQISVAYHNPQGTLGMSLNYPKAIAWDYTQLEKTDDFPMRKIYDALVAEIKKYARKPKFSVKKRFSSPIFGFPKTLKNK